MKYNKSFQLLPFQVLATWCLIMGTGTNIKAALSCGGERKSIGIELDQKTYEKAIANLASPSDKS